MQRGEASKAEEKWPNERMRGGGRRELSEEGREKESECFINAIYLLLLYPIGNLILQSLRLYNVVPHTTDTWPRQDSVLSRLTLELLLITTVSMD